MKARFTYRVADSDADLGIGTGGTGKDEVDLIETGEAWCDTRVCNGAGVDGVAVQQDVEVGEG